MLLVISLRLMPVPHLFENCNSQSLRPNILAALLATRKFGEHPLHNLAQKHPDILSRLDRLATLRDSSSHASTRASPILTLSECDRCIETVYHLVSNILNLSYSPD
jgi:hypothetical protein